MAPRYSVWVRALVTGIQHFSWSSVRSLTLCFYSVNHVGLIITLQVLTTELQISQRNA